MSGKLFVLACIPALNRRTRPLPPALKPPAHRTREPADSPTHTRSLPVLFSVGVKSVLQPPVTASTRPERRRNEHVGSGRLGPWPVCGPHRHTSRPPYPRRLSPCRPNCQEAATC